jgi:predicted MFS family arabinose efflux permease
MLPKQALAAGIARYTSMPWLGAVIGFGTGGFVIKYLGVDPTFIIMASLPVIAIALVMFSRPKPAIRITQTQPVAAIGD